MLAVVDKTKLYSLGDIDVLNSNNIIAIIGTRNCTSEGREIAYQIGYELAKAKYSSYWTSKRYRHASNKRFSRC